MSTKVYGASDDLVEVEGDFRGEVGAASDDQEGGTFLVFSDGTILAVKYGKPGHGGVWGITLVNQGSLFDRIDVCLDEDADPYSDVAHFKDGIKWAYAATAWEKVH